MVWSWVREPGPNPRPQHMSEPNSARSLLVRAIRPLIEFVLDIPVTIFFVPPGMLCCAKVTFLGHFSSTWQGHTTLGNAAVRAAFSAKRTFAVSHKLAALQCRSPPYQPAILYVSPPLPWASFGTALVSLQTVRVWIIFLQGILKQIHDVPYRFYVCYRWRLFLLKGRIVFWIQKKLLWLHNVHRPTISIVNRSTILKLISAHGWWLSSWTPPQRGSPALCSNPQPHCGPVADTDWVASLHCDAVGGDAAETSPPPGELLFFLKISSQNC